MENRVEKLNLFFEQVKTITFWQRVFGWKSLRRLSYEAYEEFRAIIATVDQLSKKSSDLSNSVSVLKNDNDHLKERTAALESDFKRLSEQSDQDQSKISEMKAQIATKEEAIRQADTVKVEQEMEISSLKQKADQLARELSEAEQENVAFRQNEGNRQKDHESKIVVLTKEIERVARERNNEKEEHQKQEIAKLEAMRETWARHQEGVKNAIKSICQKHTIEYVDNVPFKGSPDNTIRICNEYVVFDAKSPASDDLENFPTYLKVQTESVKKYVNEEGVRKEVFLVVPSNTVGVIEQYSFNLADYRVYIVTLDALEPLMLSLKRIEDYEFVNQLSPEERENICRIVGKFAHLAKRRIQIDHFFAWEFLDVLTRCKADLPKEILERVIDFEKSEKLNPPQERRAKQILTKDLESDTERIRREAQAKSIVFPPALHDDLNTLPLYEDEGSDSSKS